MKKICPYHKHEILKITQWLNEMSSYGWKLDSWGVFFCEFQEYDGERFQYQLDMDNWEDGPNEERRVQLKELGWEYVETIGGTRIHIYRSFDRKASIPEHAEFIEFNRKKFRFSLLAGILGILLTLAAFLAVPISNMQFWLVELTENEKGSIPLLLVIVVALVMKFFSDDWHNHQLYKYLGKKASSITILETEVEPALDKIQLPYGMLHWSLLAGALIFGLWVEYGNSKTYIEPLFAERYYEHVEYFSKPLDEDFNLDGKYWMNVSENVQDELFEQIMERYSGYSNYYGYSLFKKEKYDTHALWKITEQKDERFDKLIVAEGRGEFLGDGLIFVQMEDDIVYLRYWEETEIETILEKVAEIEYR